MVFCSDNGDSIIYEYEEAAELQEPVSSSSAAKETQTLELEVVPAFIASVEVTSELSETTVQNEANIELVHTDKENVRPTVTILAEDYARFLKQEIQLMKCKELCQNKTAELKRLQTQLSYFKKQVLILRKNQKNNEDSENKKPIFANVMSNI